MVVVDTSAVLDALGSSRPNPALVERLTIAGDLHAPHLIDVELLHALRRLAASGAISGERAEYLREDFASLRLRRYPHEPLSDRIWELRSNLTAYDAAFVALGEALDVPIVTCDAKLAGAPGHRATVELFSA